MFDVKFHSESFRIILPIKFVSSMKLINTLFDRNPDFLPCLLDTRLMYFTNDAFKDGNSITENTKCGDTLIGRRMNVGNSEQLC